MMNFENMGWGMGTGWLLGLILVGLLVWVLVSLLNQSNNKKNSNNSAVDHLKIRYAKGEITKDEFDQIRNTLDKN